MKQNQKHTLIVLLCLVTLVALCLTFAACNKTYSVKIANYDKAQGSVTLSPESQDGQYKEGTELTVTVKPVDGYAVESFKLGSEEKVGELNSEGKFVFKVQQDTTITVTFKSTTVAVESVSLNKQSLSVHVTKQDDTLTAQVLPENATDKTVTWTSSVPAVATVDNNGKITAVAAGETVITATAGDGKTATCTVTVTDHQLTTVSAGESGHKSVCGVDGCGYESEVSAHSLKINSDKTKFECEQCEYEVAHTHTLSYKSTDGEQHTISCTVEGCGYTSTANHSLKINSDKTKFECEQCEYEVAHSHVLETKSAGESGHKEVCKTEGCGYESAVTAHSMKINSAKDKFECEQCEYEENHTHSLSYKSTDGEQHTISCTVEGCGYTSTANHSLKINSDKTKFECEQCDYEVAHSHALETKSAGANGHKEVCKTEGCGYESAVTAHSLKINSDKTKFECEQCEYEVAHSHDLETKSVGESGHKDVCKTAGCGYEGEVKSHNLDPEAYADGDQGHHFKCLDCGYDTEPVTHVNESGWTPAAENPLLYHSYVCSVCEYTVTVRHDTKRTFDQPDGMHYVCEECGYDHCTSAHVMTKFVADDSGDTHHMECEEEDHVYYHCTYKTESVKCAEADNLTYSLAEDPTSGHIGQCACGNVLPLEAHDTEGEDGKCSKCGYKQQEEHVCADNAKNGFFDGLCDVCHKIVDNFWTFDANTGTIQNYNGTQAKVEVPSVINVDGTDKAVKVLAGAQTGNKGFRGNTTVTDVIVPQSITTLPTSAFNGCTNLKSAVILATITELPNQCFHNCKQLTTLVLSASITSISSRAFGATANYTPTDPLTIYYLGDSEQWNALLQSATDPAKTVLSNVANVYFYNAEKQTGMWHWQSGAENMIPELWN